MQKNTHALCNICGKKISASIVYKNENVFLVKTCEVHGKQKVLLSNDKAYFERADRVNLANNLFMRGSMKENCPHDCGNCANHEQHSAMTIIEVTDNCNMECATCIATSSLGTNKHKDLHQILYIMDSVIAHEFNRPCLLMLSGGEPTTHPNIFDIIKAAIDKQFNHIMLITNGKIIAEDINFVKKLSEFRDNIEIYLQFDSLKKEALVDIRGYDLHDMRMKAIDNLDTFSIHSTLVCVVKKGVNDNELIDIVNFALGKKFVRGITLQPIKATGRHSTFSFKSTITLSEIRQCFIKAGIVDDENFIPHPLNPHSIGIAYLDKSNKTNFVTQQIFNNGNTKWREEVRREIYFLPCFNNQAFKYENLFRITIISYLDIYNFDFNQVKKCCIKFATENGKLIPIDTYYMFHK